MARCIDADNFRKAMIKRFGCIPCLTDYSEASKYDIPIDDALNLEPTADVVPRAEVERIFEEIEKICRDYNRYEIGERGLFARLAELKNKYMEGKK